MPMRLIYQLLELLDRVTELMRLLDRNKKRQGRGDRCANAGPASILCGSEPIFRLGKSYVFSPFNSTALFCAQTCRRRERELLEGFCCRITKWLSGQPDLLYFQVYKD